ncbi:N-acetylneuraminate synthase [Cellvibrio zantedeschiae]|uniref:N-acetylneuraminate synthase n=1 Tax=Cellvibrio zantedeschiae TaxID=1237077 RepID=A0ABQ3AZR6_9GAMM|nr:N-acetylneuraminate synthase [Cellvibrio zantedeschiae]GGY72291.1 N-acetylneuraminate synthase [Cellvibrio zantedeschiae]
MKKHTFIIAEAGVNHNGDITLAKKLIDAAVKAGVDAVKFQTWKTELLVTEQAEMAEYQKLNTQKVESQFQMLKRLELSYDAFVELKQYCDQQGIMFLSTPDEETSATFLNDLQPIFKIGSGELTNTPFLRHIAAFNKPIILSTGMGTLAEIEHALTTLNNAGVARSNITVLHVTTQYPTPMHEVNLSAMLTIKHAFPGIQAGYSDHTLGIEVPVAAVALGATIIEKHFTLDKNMAGPDHLASLDPNELIDMVKAIRNIESALGHGRKEPTESELENRKIVRKSIVAATSITKGDILNEHNLAIRRPGNGIPPSRWDDVANTAATKSYQPGELI